MYIWYILYIIYKQIYKLLRDIMSTDLFLPRFICVLINIKPFIFVFRIYYINPYFHQYSRPKWYCFKIMHPNAQKWPMVILLHMCCFILNTKMNPSYTATSRLTQYSVQFIVFGFYFEPELCEFRVFSFIWNPTIWLSLLITLGLGQTFRCPSFWKHF